MSGRKAIPKRIRELVKNKFGGRCAYCGDMPKQVHIDHLVPVAAEHRHRGIDLNSPDNLMPACFSCNNYKMSFSLEGFRDQLSSQVNRARQYSVNFRLAERFGLVKATGEKVVFYFEKEPSHD